MKRTKIATLLREEPIGSTVTVMGWVKGWRNNQFIALNDGSGPGNLQVVALAEHFDEALFKKIGYGAAIGATGKIVESQGKGQKIELVAEKLEVFGECPLDDYPMQPKRHSMEFLRDNAHLRPRTNTFGAVLRIRHALAFAVHKFFNDRGFFYLHTPVITASDAEGAGEMFRVTTLDLNYVPFTNSRFKEASEEYYANLIKSLEENDSKVRGLINSIEKKLKTIDPNLTFKKLITANIGELKKLVDNGVLSANKEVSTQFRKILFNAQNFNFFRKEVSPKTHITQFYFPDWFFQKTNQYRAKTRVIANRIFDIKTHPALSLSFFNYRFVDKELRGLRREERSIDFDTDFFGRSTNLTVSGQLEAELGALALGEVYTFGPTFRAENSNTTRHLAEFWMIEPEVAFADLDDNMDLAEAMLKYVIQYAMAHCADDLKVLQDRLEEEEKQLPQDKRSPMPLLEKLRFVAENEFKRLTYTEAIEILKNSAPNKKGKFQFPIEAWGADLQSEHERFLVEKEFKRPVILTNYPAAIKSFYMRLDEGGQTVSAMDILFPGIGEIVGGSQREERHDVLHRRMAEMGIPHEELYWYLDTRRFGTCPHAGFGLGFERLVLFVTGMGNIRDAIPFPRTPGNAAF